MFLTNFYIHRLLHLTSSQTLFRLRWVMSSKLRMIQTTMIFKLQLGTFNPMLLRKHFLQSSLHFILSFVRLLRFRPQAQNATGTKGGVSGAIGKQGQKLDLDAVAEVNGTQLFDIQLVKISNVISLF